MYKIFSALASQPPSACTQTPINRAFDLTSKPSPDEPPVTNLGGVLESHLSIAPVLPHPAGLSPARPILYTGGGINGQIGVARFVPCVFTIDIIIVGPDEVCVVIDVHWVPGPPVVTFE